MWKTWNSLLGVVLLLSSVSWGFIIQSPPDLLFYFEKVVLVVSSKGSSANELPTVIDYNNTNTVIQYATTVTDKKQIDIQLKFNRNDSVGQDVISSLTLVLTLSETPRQYYILSNINATVQGPKLPTDTIRLLTAIPLESPKDRSFHCSRFGKLYPDFDANAKMINNTFNIEFIGLQLQAFNGTPSDHFGESYDCVGYFTAGIWSGIFIAAILIGIITWGLAMIMDVKTMDRFDDPKGKPISFGGTE